MTVRLFLASWLVAVSLPQTAELTVLSAGAVEPAMLALVDSYTRDTGRKVSIQFGTAPEITKRLASGARADVVIAPPAVVQQAVKAGRARAASETTLARVGVGMVVRRGAARPAVATVDQLRAALLAAESVVYNQASTGQYLEQLFARMSIGESLEPKTTRYGNAAQVIEHVITGTGVEIGFGPITEIKSFEPKGAVLVGPLPDEVQNYTTYAGVVMTDGRETAAGEFLRYLTTSAARDVFAETGAR